MTPARWSATCGSLILSLVVLWSSTAGSQEPRDPEAAAALGKRLFHELRLSNPGARFDASCRSCHIPPGSPEGLTYYADVLPLSLLPSSARGVKLTAPRNTPTLADSASQAFFFWDGRAAKLEEAILQELTSTHMGWLPHEREAALNEIHNMMIWDTGVEANASGTYSEEFDRAYGVELESLERDAVIELSAKTLADYIRAIETPKDAPYDLFVAANDLPSEPGQSVSSEDFAARMMELIEKKQADGTLKTTEDFNANAVRGMTVFYGKGRCAVCHVPPLFRDDAFHNTGSAQLEYDAIHGGGSFAARVPDDGAEPRRASADDKSKVDWGRWHVTRAESDLAAFRTPGLRTLRLSDPYLHNGSYADLRDVIDQKIEAGRLAKQGELRGSDPILAEMDLDESDIAAILEFLETLNSVP